MENCYGTTLFQIDTVKSSLQSIKIFVNKVDFFTNIWLFDLFLFTLNLAQSTADCKRKEVTFWFERGKNVNF